jgi:hypothetical protein
MITVFLANCQVTAIIVSDKKRSPSPNSRKSDRFLDKGKKRSSDFITSTQATDRRSSHILDRTTSITQFPLVAKSCQTKAQAGHKVEESCSNPCLDLSAPNYFPYD